MKWLKKNDTYYSEDGRYELYKCINGGWRLNDLSKGESSINGKGRKFESMKSAKQWVDFQ